MRRKEQGDARNVLRKGKKSQGRHGWTAAFAAAPIMEAVSDLAGRRNARACVYAFRATEQKKKRRREREKGEDR